MKKRTLSLLLAALMCTAVFAGCSKQTGTSSTAASTAESTVSQAAKDEYGADFAGYPIKTDDTLSFYVLVNYAYSVPDGTDRNNNTWNKQLAERTGIKVDWQSVPAGGDSAQAYNLMLSSDTLPDLFYKDALPGVATQLLTDKKIIALDDYLAKYAPAYYKFITSKDATNKAVKNDEGHYYGFAFLRENLKLGTYAGEIIRKDLLSKASLQVPTTIDEWDKVLHAFKNQNLVKYPLSSREGLAGFDLQFRGAYGSTAGFYVGDDNKVHYGYAEAGYKDYLTKLNQWYKDGLIDPDFLTNDAAALETKILNSEVGACYSTGGTVAGYVTKLETSKKSDQWVGAPYAVMKSGDTPAFIQGETDNIGLMAAITTSCKNIPLACRFLDYGYTEDGMVFFNYGDSSNYQMVNGQPQFTDAFKNDTRGTAVMMQTFTAMDGNSATLNMLSTFNGFTQLRQDCVNTWYNESALKHILPGSLTMTTDESQSIATEATAIQSCVDESISKFVLGQDSMANFDTYVQKLKTMGLEHVLQVYQAAFDRYLKR